MYMYCYRIYNITDCSNEPMCWRVYCHISQSLPCWIQSRIQLLWGCQLLPLWLGKWRCPIPLTGLYCKVLFAWNFGAKETGFSIVIYKRNIISPMHQSSLFIPHLLVTHYKLFVPDAKYRSCLHIDLYSFGRTTLHCSTYFYYKRLFYQMNFPLLFYHCVIVSCVCMSSPQRHN